MATITTGSRGHGYEVGQEIELITLDLRWWKRLWHFVTFRLPPTKREQFKITAATSSTTLDIG